MPTESKCVTFENNSLLPALFGESDEHLHKIEKHLNVTTASRGNIVSITGDAENVSCAEKIISALYNQLEKGNDVSISDVEAAIRMVDTDTGSDSKKSLFTEEIIIKTPKKQITPYSNHQKTYIEKLFKYEMVFAAGPAGTGKTYLAVAVAIANLLSHKVERIVLCRPAVEAGEKIGFLPGDMKEKVDPYMQPLYDALYDMLPAEKVQKYIEGRIIEIAPLAFMRGRTLSDAFVILDEAQNTTPSQMKMFLTRLGQGSKMVITGDLTQTDLGAGVPSGFRDALERLKDIKEIAYTKFDSNDIVRHSLVSKIVQSYES